ncbi:type I restriction endonuclease [Hungatella hathewayi]|uniref:type I restriction endonuclease n=1 Tax=Hungatella hathewayi TaxID=154046 RepID=UPI003563ABA2
MSKKRFDENSRVKIPAIVHATRLGYTYQSKKIDAKKIDGKTNIFKEIFKENINRINKMDLDDTAIDGLIKDIALLIDNNVDLGEAFYKRLVSAKGIKLIDLDSPEKNDFRVVSELSFSGQQDTFRPDITFLINGIPLSFLEVKKPNNQGYTNRDGVTKYGIQAEFNRMKDRFKTTDFVPYLNMMQVISFSNNLSYDDSQRIPLQGSFYSTPNGLGTTYNHFREERAVNVSEYVSDEVLDFILADNNITSIRRDVEFNENLKVDTPTNLFITSIYSPERIIFFIKYGIVYVNSQRDGRNKHIIRYQQYFALRNLVDKLNTMNVLSKSEYDTMKTVLWHTQGSGKTAFAYFASNVLRDYFSKKHIVTKFYFIVDRLDLLTQSSIEFADRGMTIAKIESKTDFANNIASPAITDISSQRGTYKETMNVTNIQKFSDESKVDMRGMKGIQRIYFIDEVHRGYRDAGVFLANLLGADPNGIFIGLTGTPILAKTEFDKDGKERIIHPGTTDFFSNYLHKYYYNKSIADGYTLPIKKESISMKFKNNIKLMLRVDDNKPVPISKWNAVTSSDEFISPLGSYIEEDFTQFREVINDSIKHEAGFMIVTATSEQAVKLQKWFESTSAWF